MNSSARRFSLLSINGQVGALLLFPFLVAET
jgi:hypothetical protein